MKKLAAYLLAFVCFSGIAALLVLQHPAFGQEPDKQRQQRMEKSPNYRNGKFHNQLETPMMTDDASYWKLIKMRLSGSNARQPQKPLPTVKRDLKQPVDTTQLHLTWFGHSSLLLQVQGRNILVDPVFSQRASPFQFMGPKNFPGTNIYSAADFPFIDFLLLSHDHYDHLDYRTIKAIVANIGHVYVPLGVGAHLEKWGIPGAKITELDWWDETRLSPTLLLAATPARHFSGRSLTDRNSTLWTSFVLKTPEHTLFLGGDSGYGPHFKEIGSKYGPFDLTLLESGQYHPYWRYIHMMPEETVQAHTDLQGKVLLPIHWGKFELALHDWTDPIERVLTKAEELKVTVTTPLIGQQLTVGKDLPQQRWWKNP